MWNIRWHIRQVQKRIFHHVSFRVPESRGALFVLSFPRQYKIPLPPLSFPAVAFFRSVSLLPSISAVAPSVMALKAVHVSNVPHLNHVPENAARAISSTRLPNGVDAVSVPFKPQKFAVIGHRGSGMNMLYSPDRRMKAIKENSILSFNTAAKFALDFVEFDVQVNNGRPFPLFSRLSVFFFSFPVFSIGARGSQERGKRSWWVTAIMSPAGYRNNELFGGSVSLIQSVPGLRVWHVRCGRRRRMRWTAAGCFCRPVCYVGITGHVQMVTRDDCPVIFHDNFILSEENGSIFEKRITELTLQEFLGHGPQREPGNVGKTLLRKTKDGKIFNWNVEDDDPLCTLQEAFQKADASLGFNIELKFDDDIDYQDEELIHVLQVILQVVYDHAKGRPIIFSSFQPDAARLIRKVQTVYPVFFLTNGGTEVYRDVRRNSLEEAMKLVLANGLQGIVSSVKAILKNPGEIAKIKENNLQLLTYGQLNNVPEVVYMQHLVGVDGVIVDLVKEITESISNFIKPAEEGNKGLNDMEGEGGRQTNSSPKFSQQELSFLLRLISELVQV
ncbi:hypothetical protein ACLOJK_018767 [Asimina triloba]